MEAKEILEAVLGKDVNKVAKSSVGFSLYLTDKVNPSEETDIDLMGRFAHKPEVQMIYIDGYLQVDLIFLSNVDTDLNYMYKILEAYGENHFKLMSEDSDKYPILELALTPVEYDGEFYILAKNPINWTLQPRTPSSTNSSVLRLLFKDDNVDFIHATGFDFTQYKAELERETARREALLSRDAINRMKNDSEEGE